MEQKEDQNILLVDDTSTNIYALERLLKDDNRIFLSANSGEDALKMVLQKEIDLIILDIQMPDMDGLEVAQFLKSNKKTKDIPVIFATAEKKELSTILHAFEEGAVDILFKPLDPDITRTKVAGFLKIQRQRKQLLAKDAEIEQLRADLGLATKDMEAFTYSISHDLKGPVRGIEGYAQILEEEYESQLDDEGRRLFQCIKTNTHRMVGMMDKLLELSRLGRQILTKSQVEMKDLVEQAIEEIELTTKHRATCVINTLVPIKGDAELLYKVWLNLISNAIKYSAKMESPQLEIGSTIEKNQVVYYIKDNGAGFSMKYIDILFGVFKRLHHPKYFDGIGMGLAIVKLIINKHGGNVWAEAKEDEGATFFFALPNK